MENRLNKMKSQAKGFTLVELLVVIAIIGVLAGALVIIINPATLLEKSRDATRLEDIDALNKAMVIALTEQEIQLTTATGNSGTDGQGVAGNDGWIIYTPVAGKTGLSKYLGSLPLDPTNSGNLVYTFASDGTNYEINVVLENADNANKMAVDGGNETGVLEVGTALDLLPATP